MIKSFHEKDKQIGKVWERERARTFPRTLQRPAQRTLLILDAADSLQDLRVPLGNPSSKMRGARQGRYSVPLNERWRVSFRWRESDAYVVEIVNHQKGPGGVAHVEEKAAPHPPR